MSHANIRANRQFTRVRRRPGGRALGVESLEGRALLASAAVTAAVDSLNQAKMEVHSQISAEIATLNSNIATITQSYHTFLSTYAMGNKTTEHNALRDEKYGIGQQLFLIHELQTTQKQYDSTLNTAIKGVEHGKIDPMYVPDVISTGGSNLQAEIGTIDSTASSELNGLTATFDSGNT